MDCAVCFEPLTSQILALPCAHIFHEECVEQWNRKQGTCPLCRARFAPDPPPFAIQTFTGIDVCTCALECLLFGTAGVITSGTWSLPAILYGTGIGLIYAATADAICSPNTRPSMIPKLFQVSDPVFTYLKRNTTF